MMGAVGLHLNHSLLPYSHLCPSPRSCISLSPHYAKPLAAAQGSSPWLFDLPPSATVTRRNNGPGQIRPEPWPLCAAHTHTVPSSHNWVHFNSRILGIRPRLLTTRLAGHLVNVRTRHVHAC